MNDTELADKVVAMGFGVVMHRERHPDIYGREVAEFEAGYFVTDWRVAGTLMEKIGWMQWFHHSRTQNFHVTALKKNGVESEVISQPLPRAIIEAAVSALEGK